MHYQRIIRFRDVDSMYYAPSSPSLSGKLRNYMRLYGSLEMNKINKQSKSMFLVIYFMMKLCSVAVIVKSLDFLTLH